MLTALKVRVDLAEGLAEHGLRNCNAHKVDSQTTVVKRKTMGRILPIGGNYFDSAPIP